MDLEILQDYLVLCETGNFTRAATRRNISQAAFSRRIQSLENWFGAQLVDRSTVPVSFTENGQTVEKEARETLENAFSIRSKIASGSKTFSIGIEVSMPHVIAGTSFPDWWRIWSKGKDIKARTRIGNVSEAIANFLSGSSDLLICHRSEDIPVLLDLREFESKIVSDDEFALYAAKNSKYLEIDKSLKSNLEIPLIFYHSGAYFSRVVEIILERLNNFPSGPIIVESEMSQVVMECIISDMGIGWLPNCIIPQKREDELHRIDFPKSTEKLPVHVFTRKRKRSLATSLIWQGI